MPLLRFGILTGQSDTQVKAMLDAAHRAVRSDGKRRDGPLSSRPRSEAAKRQFYADLGRELKEHVGIEPTDVVVNFTTNTDADWSFGAGRAQFLTGEL